MTTAAFSRRSRERLDGDGPIRPWSFYCVAFASFGGPLALGALGVPSLLADAGGSAGLATLISVALFAAPLWIWLQDSGRVASSRGLFTFVEAAAGRRLALAQAAVWTFSYVLYLVYTTVQIVYDLLPVVVAGEGRYQTVLALLIPTAVAGVVVAGRTAVLSVVALLAAGQLALVAASGHDDPPRSDR